MTTPALPGTGVTPDPYLSQPVRRQLPHRPSLQHYEVSALFGAEVETSVSFTIALRAAHLSAQTLERLVEVCHEDLLDNPRVCFELLRQPEATIRAAIRVGEVHSRHPASRLEHLLAASGESRALNLLKEACEHLQAIPRQFGYLREDAAQLRATLSPELRECFDVLLASRTSEADPGSFLRNVLHECVEDAQNLLEV